MLMAAYMQTSAGSTISVPTHQQLQVAALFDPDLVAAPSPSPSPSPSPPRPRNNNHQTQHQLTRPAPAAARRASSRRRPRPSRKVATTYITADPDSFRRMVHQVTGAHDLLPPHEPTTLCRPAPTRGALPTLDTSALLLGSGGAGSGSGSSSARWTTTELAASPAAASEVDSGAGARVGLGGAGYGAGAGGFPTLESWDALSY